MRKLTVFGPYLLIREQTIFGCDGRFEGAYSLGMRRKGITEKSTGVGAVMVGAVTPSFLKERESWFEGSAKLRTCCNSDSATLAPKLKPVIGENNEECAAKANECND